MPNIIEETIQGYGWVPAGSLRGKPSDQDAGDPRDRAHLYGDGDPNIAGGARRARDVENETFRFRAADEEERLCPACGGPREFSDQRRPQYPSRSGQRQDGLTMIRRHGSIAAGEQAERREAAERAAESAEAELAAKKRERAARKELEESKP